MPKGQQRKIKGAIRNVPVECYKTCQTLPRAPGSSGIIFLKLKRKLQFRGHVYYQAVRPEIVLNALNWLKANNELYKTITIDIDRIDRDLTTLEVTSISECNTSTSTDVEQPMNEQDLSTDGIITEQINEPKNEKPVINETSKKAQQENLICQDQAYLFLRQIPGTPPYWQRFMYEVVAMVKQLGIPTWFMTLL